MPFQPGQSGNPKGRPKGCGKFSAAIKKQSDIFMRFIERFELEEKELLDVTYGLAKKGDKLMIKMILETVLPYKSQILAILAHKGIFDEEEEEMFSEVTRRDLEKLLAKELAKEMREEA